MGIVGGEWGMLREREKGERERRHDERIGVGERGEKEPAHQPARQKAKRALKNEISFQKRLQTGKHFF